MSGLTVDTSSPYPASQHPMPQSQPQSHPQPQPHIYPHSRSASPVHPPYSPITPTLEHARLAPPITPSSQNGFVPRTTYTHTQPPQTTIPQPPPVPITLDENPDAIALKSAISILQLQARNATTDIRTLQQIKERAVADPGAFARALAAGEVASKSDPLLAPSHEGESDNEDKSEEEDEKMVGIEDSSTDKENWGSLPRGQSIVRCPPINWMQYAVVGESLDKLHKDQQARPAEGMPQILQPGGSLVSGGEGPQRREDVAVFSVYTPGKDKIDKIGGKKGRKR